MFAASIGLTKTSVAAIVKDDGTEIFFLHCNQQLIIVIRVEVTLDMGGYDIETELFQPLQTMLEQCKGAKSMSKYVTFDV
jgi:dynactin 1